MAAHFITRETRTEGGGYVMFRAIRLTPDGAPTEELIAQGSYWPRHRSGYLWPHQAMSDERAGRNPALGKRVPQYNLEEADLRTLVVEEATQA